MCTQRRRKVLRLRDKGHGIAEIGEEMRLSVTRVDRLIEQHRDKLQLDVLKQSHIPNIVVRNLFEREQRIDLDLTVTELAHRAELDPTHVFRLLGYKPDPDTVRADGTVYPGRIRTTIHVDHAGRLIRALGMIPAELEGL